MITSANGGFAYVEDGYVFTEESVDLTRPGALDGINLLVGCTSNENGGGAEVDGILSLEDFEKNMEDTYGADYEKGYTAADEHEAYVVDMHSSSDRWLGTFREIAKYMNANNKDMNVYTYLFDQDIPPHDGAAEIDAIRGCFHSSELWYTLNSMRNVEGQRRWRPCDYELADTITTYISNFVKTGNPNGEGLVEWKTGSDENENAFMWWHDSSSEMTTGRPGSEKDAMNLELAAKNLGF